MAEFLTIELLTFNCRQMRYCTRHIYAGMAELADALDLGSSVPDVQVQVLSPAPNKVDSFDTRVSETINLFLFAKMLMAQGFSEKRHFGIVSLCALCSCFSPP